MAPSREENPSAAVVIPAHDAALTVERAVRSVFAQQIAVEVRVVDDGSTDGTRESLEAIDDQRLRVLSHDRNQGPAAARNTAIAAVQAPFVVFLDADDELLPDAVSRLLAGFDDGGIGMVSGRVEVVGESKARRWPPDAFRDEFVDVDALLEKNWIATSGTAIRTDLVRELGGFDPALTHSEDYKLWLRAAAVSRIRMLPDVVALLHRGSPSATSDQRRTLLGRLRALQTLPPGVADPAKLKEAIARTEADLAKISS